MKLWPALCVAALIIAFAGKAAWRLIDFSQPYEWEGDWQGRAEWQAWQAKKTQLEQWFETRGFGGGQGESVVRQYPRATPYADKARQRIALLRGSR
jgi:hypothetical protein